MPKSVLRTVLGRTQFTLRATRRTPHGASRLAQTMSAWLATTRRASSRHSRGARVYGHRTTAMHKLSTPPPGSAWLVKTRRAPSRHSRDASVYGHATMAMHKLSTCARGRGVNEPKPMTGVKLPGKGAADGRYAGSTVVAVILGVHVDDKAWSI